MLEKKSKVDLHMHSLISDGTLSPVEVVRAVAAEGIEVMSLTDHDAIDGLPPALAEAERLGLRLIPGVEISAIAPQGTLHILGYYINYQHPPFLEALGRFQEARSQRNHQIVKRLQQAGYGISMEELHALAPGNKSLGRAHIARLLFDKGLMENMDEAFYKLLMPGKPAFVPKEIFTAAEAIDLIHQAGGLAVIAHPITLRVGMGRMTSYLEELKSYGLDGLEAYSTSQDRSHCRRYAALAKRLGLLITGGSDFHGTNKPDVLLGKMQDKKLIHADMLSPEIFQPLYG